eukprot:957242-Pelagomonas_calceolata.AAC.4
MTRVCCDEDVLQVGWGSSGRRVAGGRGSAWQEEESPSPAHGRQLARPSHAPFSLQLSCPCRQ